MTQPIGILGGTFDPPHNAHLAIASAALRALGLGKVLWIPTGIPPYRPAPVAAALHRVAMLKLAIAGEPRYALDERELRPGATGFTYDSVRELRETSPNTKFTLLMGADQYAKRETWHRWSDIEKLCEIAVIARPGWSIDAKTKTVPMTPMAITATDIRARLGRGEDVAGMLPPAVLAYIREHALYR